MIPEREPLLDGLLDRAERGRSRPDAVMVAGRALTDERLASAAEALAARVAGAPAVAVDATVSLETVVAVAAGLLAGVPLVPVAADAGPVERDHVLVDSGATLFLTAAERIASLGAGAVDVVPVDISARWSGQTPTPATGDPVVFVLYTSGTTGAPKGVVIRRQAVVADLDGLADAWAWTADDTVVHGLPLYHVHGLILGVVGALRLGGRVHHTGRPTPEGYAAGVDAGGTLCFGVPTIWGRLAASPAAAALRPARLLVSGSACLPVPVYEAVAARCGHRLVERYGMTETLITIAVRADGEPRPGSVGRPIAGVEARVVGEDGEPVPADGETIGSLQVRGSTLMEGYFHRPEDTAACWTADGWFVTGDVAAVDPDGYHRIVGRESTDLIKTGGFRVGAGEVESALLSHPDVREAAVVGEPHADLGEVVCAYVVLDDGAAATGEDLTAWVAGRLAAHKRPRGVYLVPGLPRNAMGKVQKTRLPPPDRT